MFFGFTTGFYAAAVQCRVVLCIAYLVKVLIRFRFFVGVETCRRRKVGPVGSWFSRSVRPSSHHASVRQPWSSQRLAYQAAR